MGFSLGFGVGPLRYSTRLSGGGRSSGSGDDPIYTFLGCTIGIPLLFYGPPWATMHGIQGDWGVTAAILAGLYLALTAVCLLIPYGFLITGTSWFFFAEIQTLMWLSRNDKPKPAAAKPVPTGLEEEKTFDEMVLTGLTYLGIILLIVAVLAVAVGLAVGPALAIHSTVLCLVFVRRHPASVAALSGRNPVAKALCIGRGHLPVFDRYWARFAPSG